MMNESGQSVADSLETNVNMLSFMPYLLQDLWALGCSIDQIIETAGKLN